MWCFFSACMYCTLRLESLPLGYFKYHHLTNEFLWTDDPYAVADKWLLKENLPLTYRQQVVEFILQNSGQNNFVPDPSFRDPYTGGKLVSFYMFWQSFQRLSYCHFRCCWHLTLLCLYQVMHMYPGNRLCRTVCTHAHSIQFGLVNFFISFSSYEMWISVIFFV